MQPKPHQSQAIDFALTSMRRGIARVLVQMPTGSGKSLVKCLVAREWLAKGHKVVLLTPSVSSVAEIYGEARQLGLRPVAELSQYKANSSDRFILSTYATFWQRQDKHIERPALLILDECHHVNEYADTNRSIYRKFQNVLGISASPWSSGCRALFGAKHVYPLSVAIRDGVNCEYKFCDMEPVPKQPFQIVYCPTNATTREISATIAHSEWILYDRKDAGEIINQFRQGTISTLVVNRKLTEGFNLPQVKKVWIKKEVRSPILAYQMLGRALRQYQGRIANCFVSDRHARETLKHALQLAG